jgi:hypothetical protein
MSLTAFKRKSVINYGSKRSGIAPGGVWLSQGPFGNFNNNLQKKLQMAAGPAGFSINGGHRNIGGVGKDMKMSKSGTPFRGTQPIGWGGGGGGRVKTRAKGGGGTYPSATLVGSTINGIQSTGSVPNAGSQLAPVQPVLNSQVVNTMGSQYLYIKPSTLSTHGMLDKKYRWAYYGKYPNYWVQPNYTGNQTDTASQWLYIQNKAAANTCNLKVNNVGTYEGYRKATGPTLCTPGPSTAMFTYNDMARNAPYTKTLYQPVSYAQYNLYVTRGCNNPVGPQKPFPYGTSPGSSYSAAGTSITSFGSGCNSNPVFLTPPVWYTKAPYWFNNPKNKQKPPASVPQTQKLPFRNE